ncbi:MAG: hypothetical protein ACI9XO_000462 [Paraglaciecola sp.]|jgi:hypothetical protein
MRLEDALADLTNTYSINFSYSSDFIPMDERITASVKNKPLSKALDKLFSKTTVIYRRIGNQIALSVDPKKGKPKLTKSNSKGGKETSIVVDVSEKDTVKIIDSLVFEPIDSSLIILEEPIVKEEMPDIRDAVPYQTDDILTPEEVLRRLSVKNDLAFDRRAAQISILPNMGTNMENSQEITNHVSLNLLWGQNGGVKGFEAGTFINQVENNVEGMQIAGLGNSVGNDVTGMQIAGLYNHNSGKTTGIQMASLFNFSSTGDAGQFAGVANVVENDFKGMQASIFFNKSGKQSNSVQASGLINVTEGTTKMQIGGLINKAKNVTGGQISGLMNIAENVKGFQFAFINVSDTVSGVPIGLINIVKQGGYNRFEISGGEMLHFNAQLKLGSPKFYNVFHVGTRLPEVAKYVWGLGYGVGVRIKKTEKHSMNYEAMAIQINENEPWTNQLNMIGRIRFLASWKLGESRKELFIGPTINVMISHLRQPVSGEIGSEVMPYHFFNITNSKRTNFKGWVGLNGGFRF